MNSENIRICADLWEKEVLTKRSYVWLKSTDDLRDIQEKINEKFSVNNQHVYINPLHFCHIESGKDLFFDDQIIVVLKQDADSLISYLTKKKSNYPVNANLHKEPTIK